MADGLRGGRMTPGGTNLTAVPRPPPRPPLPKSQEFSDSMLAEMHSELTEEGHREEGHQVEGGQSTSAPANGGSQKESPRGGQPANKGWGDDEDLLNEREVEATKKQEWQEMKDTIELIMENKIAQRREVQAAFGWDFAQLTMYVIFLVLLTIDNFYNPYIYHEYSVKSVIEKTFSANDVGDVTLQSVTTIAGIYTYLRKVVVPAVASINMTALDPRCTADGRHVNKICLEDPFKNEAQCCYTKQPNKGLFAPGSHTKNFLLTPLTLRQQRVRAEPVKVPLDFVASAWPVLAVKTEETRDGGGTLLDHDPDGSRSYLLYSLLALKYRAFGARISTEQQAAGAG
jgi:hypothetical protein